MNKLLVTAATLTLFSTPAFAQGSSSGTGGLGGYLPLAIILVIAYFWRKSLKNDEAIAEQRLVDRFVDIEKRLEKLEGS